MNTFPWVLLLLVHFLAGFLTAGEYRSDGRYYRQLKSLFRKLKEEKADNCRDLASTAGDVLDDQAYLLSQLVPFPLNDSFIENMMDKTAGFEIGDDKLRQAFTCDVMRATSYVQLVAILENKNLLYSAFNQLYNYGVATLISSKLSPFGPAAIYNFITALESAGLTELDPEGAEYIIDNIGSPGHPVIWTNYVPAAPLEGDTLAKCENTFNAYLALKDANFMNPPEFPITAARLTILNITGLDISSDVMMRDVICGLIVAVDIGGLRGMYDAFRGMGILGRTYRFVYPLLRNQVELALERIPQKLAEMKESVEGSQSTVHNHVRITDVWQRMYRKRGQRKRGNLRPPTRRKAVQSPPKQSWQYTANDQVGVQIQQVASDTDQVAVSQGSRPIFVDQEEVDIERYTASLAKLLNFLNELKDSGLLDFAVGM